MSPAGVDVIFRFQHERKYMMSSIDSYFLLFYMIIMCLCSLCGATMHHTEQIKMDDVRGGVDNPSLAALDDIPIEMETVPGG